MQRSWRRLTGQWRLVNNSVTNSSSSASAPQDALLSAWPFELRPTPKRHRDLKPQQASRALNALRDIGAVAGTSGAGPLVCHRPTAEALSLTTTGGTTVVAAYGIDVSETSDAASTAAAGPQATNDRPAPSRPQAGA